MASVIMRTHIVSQLDENWSQLSEMPLYDSISRRGCRNRVTNFYYYLLIRDCSNHLPFDYLEQPANQVGSRGNSIIVCNYDRTTAPLGKMECLGEIIVGGVRPPALSSTLAPSCVPWVDYTIYRQSENICAMRR